MASLLESSQSLQLLALKTIQSGTRCTLATTDKIILTFIFRLKFFLLVLLLTFKQLWAKNMSWGKKRPIYCLIWKPWQVTKMTYFGLFFVCFSCVHVVLPHLFTQMLFCSIRLKPTWVFFAIGLGVWAFWRLRRFLWQVWQLNDVNGCVFILRITVKKTYGGRNKIKDVFSNLFLQKT